MQGPSAFVSALPITTTRSASTFVTPLPKHANSSTLLTARKNGRARLLAKPQIRATAVPIEVEESNFEAEVLQSDVPVLVDFYAPWCGPCKLVAPLMDWVANEFEGLLKVVKVDTDKNESFVGTYNIHGLPTFAVFKDGKATGIKEGAMGKAVLENYIMEYIPEAYSGSRARQ
eukprot:GFKZ01006028.1.p1 GENE.GFKZ01006028.1~~GFKZ01006028.1.p1  ORF type:complete len:173 (+),score=26.71 GFKZ01006028.1:210-728(+)